MSKRKVDSVDSGITPPPKKAKSERSFQHSWKTGNSWLQFDKETKCMYCTLCQKQKKSNTFTTGCNILKKDSVTKHAKSKGKYLLIHKFM